MPARCARSIADSLQQLTAAVLALPQPFRETVLLRFVHDLTPAQIAAQLAAPLPTIKSRLQRGLLLLREDLQTRSGAGWRAAFGAAFGFGHAVPVVAAASSGVVAMGTGTKVVFGGALILVAFAVVLLGPGALAPSPAATTVSSPATPARGDVDRGATPTATALAPDAPSDAAARTAVAAAATVVRGRCVDEAGAALPRCEVTLAGRLRATRERTFSPALGAWLAAHPGAKWSDVRVLTAADGRFEFAFAWQPLWFSLHLRLEDGESTMRVGELTPQQVLDLGDLVMPTLCTIDGIVADTEGARVPVPWVQLRSPEDDNPPKRAAAPQAKRVEPVSTEGGTFRAQVVAGTWRVVVTGRTIIGSDEIVVPPGARHLAVSVTVVKAADAATIRGIVVDERGSPVQDVMLAAVHRTVSRGIGYGRSDDRGEFVLYREDRETVDTGDVIAWKDGQSDVEPTREVRWGTKDLRIVLPTGLAIELHVTGEANGAAIEDFAVVLAPGIDNPARNNSEDDVPPEFPDRHVGGIARVGGLTAGTYTLSVWPARSDLASVSRAIEVTAPGPLRVDVALPRAGGRKLQLVSDLGDPVPGAKVELVDPGDQRLTLSTAIQPAASAGRRAIRLQSYTSSASGEAHLDGPTGRSLALRITKDGMAPVVADVDLGLSAPLVVTIARAARLEGKLLPPALVQELLATSRQRAPAATTSRSTGPGFRLLRGEGAERELFPPSGTSPAAIADDGAFVISNTPVGTWQLGLETSSTGGSTYHGNIHAVTTVELQAGTTAHVTVELPDWLLADVEGQVRLNGALLANTVVSLSVRATSPSRPPLAHRQAKTDADGRFRARVPAGQCVLAVTRSEQRSWSQIWSQRAVLLQPGQVHRIVFDVESTLLRLRVLGDDGKPVAGVPLVLLGREGEEPAFVRARTKASDDNGVIPCEVGPQQVSAEAMPRRLLDENEQLRLLERTLEGSSDPLAQYRVVLGTVTPVRGGTATVDLRLPPEWYR